jgi:D-serine dehydratase
MGFDHAPRVFALNDQHVYLRLDRDAELAAGDLVGFGVSHPCTTFDRWRVIPVVDARYEVMDVVVTYL